MKNRTKINDLKSTRINGGEYFEVGSEIVWFFADIIKNLSFTPVYLNNTEGMIK